MERELAGTIERWFYWLGAVAFIAVVAYGFSFTVEQNLLHPKLPRPSILYVHAAIFASWLLLFFTQATLVRARQIRLHRSLGVVAIGLGTAVPIVGVWIALVMARWRLQHGSTDADGRLSGRSAERPAAVQSLLLSGDPVKPAAGLPPAPDVHCHLRADRRAACESGEVNGP